MNQKRLAEIEAALRELVTASKTATREQLTEMGTKRDALIKERDEVMKAIADAEEAKKRGKKMSKPELTPEMEMEYREAFRKFIIRGEQIPLELRGNAYSTTSNTSAVIPQTVVNRVWQAMENIGKIYNRVTITNFKGGVSIPAQTAVPTATWVAERSGSDKQAAGITAVTFAYFKLRCVIACSFELNEVALPAFEDWIVNAIAKAMVRALEAAIVAGGGSEANAPTGIATVTPKDGQSIAATPSLADVLKAEGALPDGYDGTAVWIMNKKTHMQFRGITDDGGMPIFDTTRKDGDKLVPVLYGREVFYSASLPEYAASLDSNTVWAVLVDLNDYCLNLNRDLLVTKYMDHDTDDVNTKALMLADGKLVVNDSLVVLKK